jgi:hypothetical protein
MRITVLAAAIAVTSFLGNSQPAAAADDSWKFSLTPYLWGPTINGDLRYHLPPGSGDGVSDIRIGPNDYLSSLKFALLLAGDARKGRCSVVSDLVYLNFEDEKSRVREIDFGAGRLPVEASIDLGTQSSLKGTAWTLAAGYTLNANPSAPLDVIGGFRYLGVDTSTAWVLTGTVAGPGPGQSFPREGMSSKDVDLWDGIVGLRGHAKLGARWNMPYYVDAGTGSSSLTWQAMLGVTHSYGWGDLGLVYRHLSYDQKDDGNLQNFSFSGPAVTATFRF